MQRECSILKGQNLFDEYATNCKFNKISVSKKEIFENKKFNYLKFILIFSNLFLIISLLKSIFSNIKKIINQFNHIYSFRFPILFLLIAISL